MIRKYRVKLSPGGPVTIIVDGKAVHTRAWMFSRGTLFTVNRLRTNGELQVFDLNEEGATWIPGWRADDPEAVPLIQAMLVAKALA